jgi:hypothetical protein
VVAEAFPKAGLIMVHQRHAPYPFRALPQIKVGDKKFTNLKSGEGVDQIASFVIEKGGLTKSAA